MTVPQVQGAVVPQWDLADRMTKALRVSGLGVSEMADMLGVTRETVGRWINDRGEPKRAAIVAWASLTGVDLLWLETGQTPVDGLPRLDSNQQPSGYPLTLVRSERCCPFCGLPLEGHDWTCTREDAEVYDLAAYRMERAS